MFLAVNRVRLGHDGWAQESRDDYQVTRPRLIDLTTHNELYLSCPCTTRPEVTHARSTLTQKSHTRQMTEAALPVLLEVCVDSVESAVRFRITSLSTAHTELSDRAVN